VKRCKSTAPVHTELRCELERGHQKRNPRSLHKSGDIVWDGDGMHAHRPGGTIADLLRRIPAGISFGIDTTPLRETAEDRFGKGAEPTFVAMDEAAAFASTTPVADRVRRQREQAAAFAAPADPEQQLIDWWMGKAAAECEQTVSKAIEYGSTDLIDIGMMLARTMRREVDEEEAAELGVFFYLIGKVARWQSAIERGDRPSADTLLDIGVYVRMAQRIRHAGGWPGVDLEENHG
jgi:hypothetical protein